MQAHGGFVRCFVFFHDSKHLLQRHLGAVADGAVRPRQPQQRRQRKPMSKAARRFLLVFTLLCMVLSPP